MVTLRILSIAVLVSVTEKILGSRVLGDHSGYLVLVEHPEDSGSCS